MHAIIESKDIITRKNHICDNCKNEINTNEKCHHIKLINTISMRYVSVWYHLECVDKKLINELKTK